MKTALAFCALLFAEIGFVPIEVETVSAAAPAETPCCCCGSRAECHCGCTLEPREESSTPAPAERSHTAICVCARSPAVPAEPPQSRVEAPFTLLNVVVAAAVSDVPTQVSSPVLPRAHSPPPDLALLHTFIQLI